MMRAMIGSIVKWGMITAGLGAIGFLAPLHAQTSVAVSPVVGWCQVGGQFVVLQGLKSSATTPIAGGPTETNTGVQASYPSCTVTVFNQGTSNLSTIFKDRANTALSNPFTANTDGSFLFYITTGSHVDVQTTATNMPETYTAFDQDPGGVLLQTNGVNNATQSQLNIVGGTGFSVVNSGATVTISSGITFQTNGTNNSSQTNLNLQNGTNVTITNPSAGNVTITSAYPLFQTAGVSNASQTGLNLVAGTNISVANGGVTDTIASTFTTQTNGTLNASQTALNLIQGTGISIVNSGFADTISSGITFQVNGVNDSSQVLANFTNGANVTITNTSGGIISIASAYPVFQTNGVNNASQTTLNLASGSGIGLVNSSGTVTISSAGGTSILRQSTSTLGAGVAIPNSNTTILSSALTMPSTGCPCRAVASYSIILNTANSGQDACLVSDATNSWDTAQVLTTGAASNYGLASSAAGTGTYSNNSAITFTLICAGNHAGGSTAEPASGVGPSLTGAQGTWLNIAVYASN